MAQRQTEEFDLEGRCLELMRQAEAFGFRLTLVEALGLAVQEMLRRG